MNTDALGLLFIFYEYLPLFFYDNVDEEWVIFK